LKGDKSAALETKHAKNFGNKQEGREVVVCSENTQSEKKLN
jgi:hypothetical protein